MIKPHRIQYYLEKRWPTWPRVRTASSTCIRPSTWSWLNLIEMAFSKMARSFLRRIRVRSRDELKERILKGIAEMNQAPTVMRWRKFDLGLA